MAFLLIIAFAAIVIAFAKKAGGDNKNSQSPTPKNRAYQEQAPYGSRESFEKYKKEDEQRRLEWAQNAARKLIESAGRPDPNTGFFNMPKWKVSGKKKSTGRKNTVEIRAMNEASAKVVGAAMRDMVEPITVEQVPLVEKTYSEEIEISLPDGTGSDDVWELELSVSANDTEPIPNAFYGYLTAEGVPISRLSGRNRGVSALLEGLKSRDRAALYAYFVDCGLRREMPGDMKSSPRWPIYQSFADIAMKETKVKASIDGRPGEDFWKPNKQTTAYKFTAGFLSDK